MEGLSSQEAQVAAGRSSAARTRRLAALGLLLVVCYAALLSAVGLTPAIAPMAAIVVASGVSSIAGFAFSAVSQAMLAPLVHDPLQIVQILMVCSITTQSYAIVSLWRHMEWRRLPVFLVGGVLGLPGGVYLLLHLNLGWFHVAIGIILFAYGTYTLLKRPIVLAKAGWPAEMAVGFLGGITGGLAAFPGAAITVFCTMRGWDKARQRGVYQPYILAMQLLALGTIAVMRTASGGKAMAAFVAVSHAFVFVPATLLGSWFGLHIFHRISDRNFERCLALMLASAGALLIV